MSRFVPETKKKDVRRGYKALQLDQAHLEDGLAGSGATKPEKWYEQNIRDMLNAAGAIDVSITAGFDNHFQREAFQLKFNFEGLERIIYQVVLPIRKTKTDSKKKQVRKQALYNLHESVRMELERRHYQPENPAFISYMVLPGKIDADGDAVTVGQALFIGDFIPLAIEAESQIIEGEISQD